MEQIFSVPHGSRIERVVSMFRVLIYHERELLCSYEGVPPDVGESVWVMDAKKDLTETRYVVERRMWYANVYEDGKTVGRREVMVKE
jgi:hypothetical protein